MIKELEKRLLSSLFLIPIAIFFIIQGSVFFIFFLSILFLATSYEWLKMNKKNNLLKSLGIIFLLFSFYVAFTIREANSFKPLFRSVLTCLSWLYHTLIQRKSNLLLLKSRHYGIDRADCDALHCRFNVVYAKDK